MGVPLESRCLLWVTHVVAECGFVHVNSESRFAYRHCFSSDINPEGDVWIREQSGVSRLTALCDKSQK